MVESGALLDLVRADLRDYAASLRAPAPGELPVTLEPGEICLTLPPWVGLLRLVTPSSITPGDERRLGAAITRLLVDDDDLTLNDPRLVSGFHALETTGGRSWRWTDGDAVLLLDVASRARDVRITVAACAAQRRAA
jgi:hypothetical protein